MAATAAPYGFVPVNRMSGYEGGSFRQLKMTNSYGTSMFFGDVAELVAAGTIELDTAATSTRPIGIFQGCNFTDPNLNYKVFSQMWTASTSATDILAHVADDPRQVFQAQSDGNTNIGKSILALDFSGLATTATFPWRTVAFVDGPFSAVGDAFTDMLVVWNADIHQYDLALGT